MREDSISNRFISPLPRPRPTHPGVGPGLNERRLETARKSRAEIADEKVMEIFQRGQHEETLLALNRSVTVVRSTSTIVLSTVVPPRLLPLLEAGRRAAPSRSPAYRPPPS